MLAHAIKSLGFSGYYQLSVTQQTILADCLERGNAEINLPAHNAYGDALCRNGWLREIQSVHLETRSYIIPIDKWQELQSMKSQILTPQMQADVRRFRSSTLQRF
ncbi:MAG TPA: hypothetical protein V6C97_16880 [Oculatellaceae cyanobacterium]